MVEDWQQTIAFLIIFHRLGGIKQLSVFVEEGKSVCSGLQPQRGIDVLSNATELPLIIVQVYSFLLVSIKLMVGLCPSVIEVSMSVDVGKFFIGTKRSNGH